MQIPDKQRKKSMRVVSTMIYIHCAGRYQQGKGENLG